MTTDPQRLEAVAAAVERLRTAVGPVGRMQAARAAADAAGELSPADRQVLVRGLLAHGGPVAARVLDGHRVGRMPPESLVAVAQDLLALAPIEADRLGVELWEAARVGAAAERSDSVRELRDAGDGNTAAVGSAGHALAAVTPPIGTARTRGARSQVPAGGSGPPARSVSTPPPVPAAVRRRAREAAEARRLPVATATTSSAHPHDGTGRQPPTSAGQVGVESDLRGQLRRLASVTRGRGPLATPEVLELLRAFPDGWRRRTAFRHLVTAPGLDPGADALAIVEEFTRPGDRFAVAALLVRKAGVPAEQLLPALGSEPARRLWIRGGRRRPTAHP